jgi:DNA modification methylase
VTNQNVRSNRGDIVLDCFLGSGTTLLAADAQAASVAGSSLIGCRSMQRSAAGRI